MDWTLTRCTLTGADDATDIDALWETANAFPIVEWGILYSLTQRGTGRYPSEAWLERLITRVHGGGSAPHLALHVCGRSVADLIKGVGPVVDIARYFARIQVNFRADNFEIEAIREMVRRHAGQTIITQHNAANVDLWRALQGEPNHVVLFDASGGRGLVRADWPAPLQGVSCGYAGGLGPDNIDEAVAAIHRAAGCAQYWVDMENKLRTAEDRFDMNLARDVLTRLDQTLRAGGSPLTSTLTN
jgi:hypothetical protein